MKYFYIELKMKFNERVEQVRDGGDQDQSGLGKFGCIPCGMSFRDGGNLKRHVTLVHEVRVTPVKEPLPGFLRFEKEGEEPYLQESISGLLLC